MTDAPKYAAWFEMLLQQHRPLIDTNQFEKDAYDGYVSYGCGAIEPGADFRPIPFEKWVEDFRQRPIDTLYWGNDKRHTLAPHAEAYIDRISCKGYGDSCGNITVRGSDLCPDCTGARLDAQSPRIPQ